MDIMLHSSSHTYTRDHKLGFTIVELLIVIVVIGILAAIIIVAFNGVKERAAVSTLQSDLRGAATLMKVAQVDSGEFPTTLPSSVKASEKVTLSLDVPGGDPVYTNLSPEHNGLLFFDMCNKLISEGIGSRASEPDRPYISECRVYNTNQLDINGWNGRAVNVPISTASLDTYVSSYVGGEKELFTTEANNFMSQWVSRFQASGGTMPVTKFWDSWATPTNGGVMKPTMPTPTSSGGTVDPTTFCINAIYDNDSDLRWHITQTGAPTAGVCA